MNKIESCVEIKHKKSGKVNIEWNWVTFHKEFKGKVRCFIPAYDIYFTVNDVEEISQKSKNLLKIFFSYILSDYPKNNKLQYLGIQLRKRGFQTDSFSMSRILKNLPQNAKFKPSEYEVPNDFQNATKTASQSLEMAL